MEFIFLKALVFDRLEKFSPSFFSLGILFFYINHFSLFNIMVSHLNRFLDFILILLTIFHSGSFLNRSSDFYSIVEFVRVAT